MGLISWDMASLDFHAKAPTPERSRRSGDNCGDNTQQTQTHTDAHAPEGGGPSLPLEALEVQRFPGPGTIPRRTQPHLSPPTLNQ